MKRVWILVCIIVLIVSVLLDLFLAEHGHVDFPWLHIPAFFSMFGFLGCLLLIGFSKLIGHYWLQRREDYYDKNDSSE